MPDRRAATVGLPEVIAVVAAAIVIAAGVSALVVSLAVRRVRRQRGEQRKPTVGV
jgi:multisubunit Na+/H+ antiporter MnhC subunit